MDGIPEQAFITWPAIVGGVFTMWLLFKFVIAPLMAQRRNGRNGGYNMGAIREIVTELAKLRGTVEALDENLTRRVEAIEDDLRHIILKPRTPPV